MDIEKIKDLKKTVNRETGPWRKQKACSKIKGGRTKSHTPQADPNNKESVVQREVIEAAATYGLRLWRQQAGMVWAGSHPIHLAPKGAADLTGIIHRGKWFGRRIEVECKRRDGGIQSKEQKEWQEFIEENGGIYLLVHSGQDFLQQLVHYI
jgi:hypothetical protein